MEHVFFKRSAIHNLRIDEVCEVYTEAQVREGLVVPIEILEKADIRPWEQVIVTSIGGDSWRNRVKTFVIPSYKNYRVVALGSLGHFLSKGSITCLISRTLLDERGLKDYADEKYYTFDLGFDPSSFENEVSKATLDIEYKSRKEKGVVAYDYYTDGRITACRLFLASLVQGLVVNSTHPDCLQGSAELPGEIMEKSGILKYQSVTVYNSSKGGSADTYAVPMPAGVVMTTGAMATFAKVGESVNVATYKFSDNVDLVPRIISTDGNSIV